MEQGHPGFTPKHPENRHLYNVDFLYYTKLTSQGVTSAGVNNVNVY